MTRLGVALGANPLTFAGLAGVGDLIATCQSPLSRNRTIGEHLGKGMTMQEAQKITSTTSEGVKSCQSILDLAKQHNVAMPITEQVVNVIHHGQGANEVVRAFMTRSDEGVEKMEHL
jgi:glycerol-3-phosphate dehydrogenase (NAD(P)+)